MLPWNSWYHITGNTYGTWLPGDPRTWRTRHGRPQPGSDIPLPEPDRAALHGHARRLMEGEPIPLSTAARRAALDAIIHALHHHTIEVAIGAVDDHHFHLLARFPDRHPRRWVGIAKKESSRALSSAGLAEPGGVWAARTHCQPIRDRDHQLEVARYIADHAERGAALHRCPPPTRDPNRTCTDPHTPEPSAIPIPPSPREPRD